MKIPCFCYQKRSTNPRTGEGKVQLRTSHEGSNRK